MGKWLMRPFPGKYQSVQILGNKRSGENRVHWIEDDIKPHPEIQTLPVTGDSRTDAMKKASD
jgi:hypothetical protein